MHVSRPSDDSFVALAEVLIKKRASLPIKMGKKQLFVFNFFFFGSFIFFHFPSLLFFFSFFFLISNSVTSTVSFALRTSTSICQTAIAITACMICGACCYLKIIFLLVHDTMCH